MRLVAAGFVVLVLSASATSCEGSDAPTTTGSPANRASAFQLRPVEKTASRRSPAPTASNPPELTCPGENAGNCLAARTSETVVVAGADSRTYILAPVIVDGSDVERAHAYGGHTVTGNIGWSVALQLSPEGSAALASATRASVGTQIAMVVDGLVVSAPTVQAHITSGNLVLGSLSKAEAERLAERLDPSG